MLQKVFSINLFDYKYSSGSNGELDLLMFSFSLLLKKALAQGLYKQYQIFKRNDENIKGMIDVSRHINQNIPFNGKISYKSRERTFDNFLTQLIRHTIEYIKTKPFGKLILNCDLETKECVQEIIAATESYNMQNREKVIAENLKPVNHPYYTAYKPLQKLCLAILMHRKIGYGKSDKKIYGILFDGAWLWEEYLATILTKCGFRHPRNKVKTGGISVYSGNLCYPDFYMGKQLPRNAGYEVLEKASKENFVLDAKYKHLDNSKNDGDEIKASFSRDDLHQLITYMYILPAEHGGLIYPYDKADRQNNTEIIISSPKVIFGYGGEICTYGVPIPVKTTYQEFVNQMGIVEDNIKKKINESAEYKSESDC